MIDKEPTYLACERDMESFLPFMEKEALPTKNVPVQSQCILRIVTEVWTEAAALHVSLGGFITSLISTTG